MGACCSYRRLRWLVADLHAGPALRNMTSFSMLQSTTFTGPGPICDFCGARHWIYLLVTHGAGPHGSIMEPLLRPTWPLAFNPSVCTLCHGTPQRTAIPAIARRTGLQSSNRIRRRFKGYIAPEGEQARPIAGFYAGRAFSLYRTNHMLTIVRNTEEISITSAIGTSDLSKALRRSPFVTERADVCKSRHHIRLQESPR